MIQDTEDFDATEIGRRLGHDLYRWCRPASPGWPSSVNEGFATAGGQQPPRKLPDRYVAKWIQLRLGAFKRGRAVHAGVTPELLRAIDVTHCPVTRKLLTHGELSDTDWSVDRLNNDGAYAANNLAVMSVQANRAKGSHSYEHIFALSERETPTDGLAPREWLRLAALMLGPCFATRPHLAPAIPLTAPIPPRSARPAIQQIQHVFTLNALRPAGKNQLIRHFRGASSEERALIRLQRLAEAVHGGLKGLDERHDVWLQPGVMDSLTGWRTALDEPSWARAGDISRRLAGSRIVPSSRLASWRLESGGYMS